MLNFLQALIKVAVAFILKFNLRQFAEFNFAVISFMAKNFNFVKENFNFVEFHFKKQSYCQKFINAINLN